MYAHSGLCNICIVATTDELNVLKVLCVSIYSVILDKICNSSDDNNFRTCILCNSFNVFRLVVLYSKNTYKKLLGR